MRVLIVKTSSLGDVIHTLPALTEAGKYWPDIAFDWALEPAFSDMARFHPRVKNIILSPLRQWRQNIAVFFKTCAYKDFYLQLRQQQYDYIIDAQGLIKSGLLTFFARGVRCGYDRRSAWEPLSCLAYDKKFSVSPDLHAIMRIRQLFAQALNYKIPVLAELPDSDYGISDVSQFSVSSGFEIPEKYAVFLHGTTRQDKCWPDAYWIILIELLQTHDKNLKILLPWGNAPEKKRAEKIAFNQPQASVLPQLELKTLAGLLSKSQINVAVDTGLGHLSAALNKRTISLYGPTDPALIGTVGKNQVRLKADSLAGIMPEKVFSYFL